MATRGAAALIAVVAALASVSLAMSPSVVTENGQLVLEVAAGTRVQVRQHLQGDGKRGKKAKVDGGE